MPIRVRTLWLSIVCAGCGVEPTPHDTGGIDLDALESKAAANSDCPRGLTVVSSDYQSTNVGLLDLEGRVLSSSFVSSASTSTGLSAPLSGDVVAPSSVNAGDEILLIDRYPASVLSWVDLRTAKVPRQLSVATGFAANPHDYAQVSSRRAFVSRFEHNQSPGRQPFDAGSDLLILDSGQPSIAGRIDLLPAMQGEDAAYLPRPDNLVLVGGRLYVLLSSYSGDFMELTRSRIVAIDVRTESIDQVLVLDGLMGCTGMTLAPDAVHLALTCSGKIRSEAPTSLEGSGVVQVELGEQMREGTRFEAMHFAGGALGFSVAYASDTTLLVTSFGHFGSKDHAAAEDTLLSLDLDSGAVEVVLESASEPFTIGEVLCAAACEVCFVADAGRSVVHRFEVRAGRIVGREAISVDETIGLPPRYLGFF